VAEPWFLQRAGSREGINFGDGGDQRTSFLLGAFARVAPGLRKQIAPTATLAIAPVVEIAGSAVPRASGGVIQVVDSDGPLFRVGGLEFTGGLELGFWFALE
jgi:hypothetical protein